MRRLALIPIGVLLACGNGGDRPPAGRRRPPAGPVVAEVDGVAIHLPTLEARMRQDGVSPREALDRLIQEELTIEAARRLGLRPDRDLGFTRKRAEVQALLAHEIESKIGPDGVTERDIARGYEAGRVLEADHLLARLRPSSTTEERARARALAMRVAAAARQVADRDAFVALATTMGEDGVELVHEDLGSFKRTGRFVRAFEDRVFRMTRAGEVSEAFETEFGWHVVRLRAADNELGPSLEQARPEVIQRLVTVRRRAAYDALVQGLRERGRVEVDEAALGVLDTPP